MKTTPLTLALALAAGLTLASAPAFAARPDYDQPNYDPAKIAPYALEDPLTFLDGTRVKTPADWPRRREEILGVFAREMFGQPPPAPEAVVAEKIEEGVTLGGFAIRRQYRMWFKADKSGPFVDWLVLLPKKAKGPVPVISFLNYDGNHTLLTDPEVVVPEGCFLRFTKGNAADPAQRGLAANANRDGFYLPAGVILSRGYALMSACYGQISPDPDRREANPAHRQETFAYTRIFDLWPKRDATRDDNITAIGAWAWTLSRGLDLAERIPEIDARRAVVTGYSRLGKTALLAAARDERFAVCVPNQTGGGGCPLAKRDYGENVATEVKMFTHWYCAAYAKYKTDPANLLTFDQHLLLASIAPRALLVQGFDERWFDTEGEYLACRAASPAWTLFGLKGLPDGAFPADYDTSLVGPTLGYVRRDLWHGLAAHDWTWLLDFSDRHFARATGRFAVSKAELYVDNQARRRSGHMGHALVDCGGGRLIDFNSNVDVEHCDGHSGYGWMEYRVSTDYGRSWGAPRVLDYSMKVFKEGKHTALCEKAVRAPDGRIILFFQITTVDNCVCCEPWSAPTYVESRDGGETWSEAKIACPERGRIYDAVADADSVYFLIPTSPNFCAKNQDYAVYKSTAGGPFVRHKTSIDGAWKGYGAMEFAADGALVVYAYDSKDETHPQYCVSRDRGETWEKPGRAFLPKLIRNPQMRRVGSDWFLCGRNGGGGDGIVLYHSRDGFNWDAGVKVDERPKGTGTGYYSCLLPVFEPGRNPRLLMQYSHPYHKHCVNVMHRWIELGVQSAGGR